MHTISQFDHWISSLLDAQSHRSWALDTFFVLLAYNLILKGGIVVLLYSWAWFRRCTDLLKQRQYLICGLIGAVAAPCFARLVAVVMPFRERPLHNPALHWQLAYGVKPNALIDWSSFPSDHAALLAALATALCFVSRTAGVVLFAYVFVFVEFARVYLGFHYFSDILVGTLIGVAISGLLATEYPRSLVAKHILPVADRNPQYFYPALVSYLYMVAMVFDPLRDILHYIHAITRAFFARLLAMMHNSRWGFEEVGLIVAIGCVIILILAVRGRSANRAIGTNSNL